MSEFHAAVGLAELDAWPEKYSALTATSDRYRRQCASSGMPDRFLGSPDVAGCYALFRAQDEADAVAIQRRLSKADIEFRLWYGRGLLEHQHFHGAEHDALHATERLATTLVGLPAGVDLSDSTIDRVVAAVSTCKDGC
jgi:dTDP-4-amino-4,6-dideoxygalactose transaminase